MLCTSVSHRISRRAIDLLTGISICIQTEVNHAFSQPLIACSGRLSINVRA